MGYTSLLQLYYIFPQIRGYILIAVILYPSANMGVHAYCSYTKSFRKYGSTSLLQLYYILPQIWEYILIAVIIYSPANMVVHPYCSYNIFSRKYGSTSILVRNQT